MTSSSSPGISLKSEGVSYLAGSDLPAVIVNVQRGGPGLGSIQPSQSDYWQATKALGHGDFQLIVFAPASVQETVDMTIRAFEEADRYRMPVMILTDGFIGQMMEPVTFSDETPKIEPKDWAACGHKGGRKHNIINSLFLQPDELEASVDARYEKYETIKKNIHDAEIYKCEDADLVITAFGTTARVAKSAVNQAREKGIKAGLFRPKTLWPFPVEELNAACKTAKKVLSVEMSKGQMVDDIRLALNCRIPVEFFGRNGGNIPTPAEILDEIVKISERGL